MAGLCSKLYESLIEKKPDDHPGKYVVLNSGKWKEKPSRKIPGRKDKYGIKTYTDSDVISGLTGTCLSCYNKHVILRIYPDDFHIFFAECIMHHLLLPKNESCLKGVLFPGRETDTDEKVVLHVHMATLDQFVTALELQALTQMKKNGGNAELIDLLVTRYSTSSEEHTIAKIAALFKTYEKFIDLRCWLGCGIPAVRMMGELSDWQRLKETVENLFRVLSKGLNEPLPHKWKILAVDICDRLIDTYLEKETSEEWWCTCISKVTYGSGGSVGLNGWLPRAMDLTTPNPYHRPLPVDIDDFRHLNVKFDFFLSDEPHELHVEAGSTKKEKGSYVFEGERKEEIGVKYHWKIEKKN